MGDRELLQLAAKAAGYGVRFQDGMTAGIWTKESGVTRCYWNPLEEDGDTARLEVSCQLSVDVTEFGVLSEKADGIACFETFTKHNGDRNKARRRASVRAAAEIGKAGAQ